MKAALIYLQTMWCSIQEYSVCKTHYFVNENSTTIYLITFKNIKALLILMTAFSAVSFQVLNTLLQLSWVTIKGKHLSLK